MNLTKLIVFDLDGVLVDAKQIHFETDFLSKGIYIVKIESNDFGKVYFKKIIKK